MTRSTIYLFGALMAFALVVTSYYFEYVVGLEPCPLCLIQRYLMALLVPLFVWRWYVTHWVWSVFSSLGVLFVSTLGVAAAGRHVWLEWQPDDAIVSCLPDLEYMLMNFSFSETLDAILDGSGCSQIDWQWLGVSMPTWVLLWFLAFTVLAIIGLFSSNKRRYKVDAINTPK